MPNLAGGIVCIAPALPALNAGINRGLVHRHFQPGAGLGVTNEDLLRFPLVSAQLLPAPGFKMPLLKKFLPALHSQYKNNYLLKKTNRSIK